MRRFWLVAAAAVAAGPPVAQAASARPAHTYSIVARDPATGELGVAVQSHWFSVGSSVLWAEAGVGAIATQSFTEPSYGPLGLALMRAGRSAPQALAGLVAADPDAAVRQVAMIDARGGVAAHTGARCIPEAGQHIGENYSAQANLMLKATVWDAMARAFESGSGDLAERLMLALEAAQKEGGDIRGRQSAALLVVEGAPSGKPWADRLFDLRVEDHPEPLLELRRLLGVARAYQHMDEGDEAATAGDMERASREYGAAAGLVPDNPEMVYWHAVALASSNRLDEALPLFKQVFAADRNWAILTPRLPKVGLLPDDPDLLKRILGSPTP